MDDHLVEVAALAQPFIDECKKRGWQGIIMVTDRPEHGHLCCVNKDREFFNSPPILLHIASLPQRKFQNLTSGLTYTPLAGVSETDHPQDGSPGQSGSLLSPALPSHRDC